jgi:methyl-accepting chemotaxis protein
VQTVAVIGAALDLGAGRRGVDMGEPHPTRPRRAEPLARRDDEPVLHQEPLGRQPVGQPKPDVAERRSTHPAEDEVLMHCGPGMAAGAVAHDLSELSQSNFPIRAAASALNDNILAVHMRVFRYVSWAGNGVSHPLMENLSSEIAIDFGLIQEEFDELATRADLTAAEKAELAALQTKIKEYERTTRDVLEVGRTDAAMATMMLGQTDDKYVGVEEDIRKILAVIAADSTSIVRNLVTATKTEALSLAIGLIICLVFSVAAIAFIARSIIKPITLITGVMQKLSAGDTAVTLRYRERTDEIGRMIEAIEIFRSNALEIQKIQQLRRQAEEQQASERRTEMAALAEEFDSTVKHITSELAGAVTAVRDNAEAMTKVAEDTRTKSGTAVEAVAHTQENVETVARAASELSLTIDELSRRTNDVFRLTRNTAEQSESASAELAKLAASVEQILPITDLIRGLAQQTNLLALNATIEAARAGIAGRGFAVVASEVKTLAQASGKATDDIAQKIGAVRETCTSAVATISQIIAAIKDLSIHATEISSGIRQQSNETAGIFASAESAASNSRSVAANMVELNGYADATYTASNEVRHTTALLFEHTRAVQSNVERFLQHVKRA